MLCLAGPVTGELRHLPLRQMPPNSAFPAPNPCLLNRITRFWRQKRPTHLRLDYIRPPVDVCRGKAQQTESRIDQEILPTVIFDQTVAVVATVVLEHQPRRRVV